jgi:hypothetical protein
MAIIPDARESMGTIPRAWSGPDIIYCMETREIRQHALIGLKHRLTQVDQQIAELERDLAGGSKTGGEAGRKPRRKMSATTRKRMARAQQARWRKIKQDTDGKLKARYAGG